MVSMDYQEMLKIVEVDAAQLQVMMMEMEGSITASHFKETNTHQSFRLDSMITHKECISSIY